MRLHSIERGADNPRTRLADVERLAAGDFSIPAHSAPQPVVTASVGVRVGGNKARTVGDEKGRLMHHFPVVGSRFAHDNEIRVDIRNGKPGFIEFVNQCAFTDYVSFFSLPDV